MVEPCRRCTTLIRTMIANVKVEKVIKIKYAHILNESVKTENAKESRESSVVYC